MFGHVDPRCREWVCVCGEGGREGGSIERQQEVGGRGGGGAIV